MFRWQRALTLGKTSALLIPTLNAWNGTSMIIDISGDITEKTPNIPDKVVFQITDPNTIPFNIFSRIDRMGSDSEKEEALAQLAMLLMPENETMSDASLFYTREGRKILTGSLIAFYFCGLDFVPICKAIVDNNYQDLFDAIKETGNEKAAMYIKAFEGTSYVANCKQNCDAAVSLFALNDNVSNCVRRPDPGEEALVPESVDTKNVFVLIEDHLLDLYSPVLAIWISLCCEHILSRPYDRSKDPKLLFALDELRSFGYLPLLGDLYRKGRKRGVRLITLTQSLSDYDAAYGVIERKAQLENAKYKVFLSAEAETEDYARQLCGVAPEVKISTSRSSNSFTVTRSENQENIIKPGSLNNLGDNLLLVFPGGHVFLEKNFYFKK